MKQKQKLYEAVALAAERQVQERAQEKRIRPADQAALMGWVAHFARLSQRYWLLAEGACLNEYRVKVATEGTMHLPEEHQEHHEVLLSKAPMIDPLQAAVFGSPGEIDILANAVSSDGAT